MECIRALFTRTEVESQTRVIAPPETLIDQFHKYLIFLILSLIISLSILVFVLRKIYSRIKRSIEADDIYIGLQIVDITLNRLPKIIVRQI